MATCPECDAEIDVDDSDLEEMEVGDPWDCDACGSRLRVAILDPLDFETDDEDDEDDEDEEEETKEGEEVEDDADDDDADDDGTADDGWEE
jgi:lysine biosynthesis protein LysW